MRICIECRKEQPLDNFYKHSVTGNAYGRCKECHKKKANSYKDKQPQDHKKNIHDELQKIGVPVFYGKQVSDKKYKYVDLIVYGQYKIECKLMAGDRLWLTKRQANPLYADFLILIYEEKLYFMPYGLLFKDAQYEQRVFAISEQDISERIVSPKTIKEYLLNKLYHLTYIQEVDNTPRPSPKRSQKSN